MRMLSRKGISPLIATVLLIAFTIAIGGIISIWLTQFTRTQADEQKERGELASECSQSRYFFAKSDINVSLGVIKVIISNEGSVNQTDYDVYATKNDGTLLSNTTPTWRGNNSVVQPGEKVQITANMSDTSLINSTNLTNVRVTLGPVDRCTGKEYEVKFP